jgi:hypothetical protein
VCVETFFRIIPNVASFTAELFELNIFRVVGPLLALCKCFNNLKFNRLIAAHLFCCFFNSIIYIALESDVKLAAKRFFGLVPEAQ